MPTNPLVGFVHEPTAPWNPKGVVVPDGVLWCPMSVEAVVYEAKRKWVRL